MPSRAAGFTLVELLIVITLLATLSAILVPVLLPSPVRILRAAAADVATTLRETRRQAQAGQRRQRFMVETRTRRFGIQGASVWHSLPDDVNVALTTGETLLTDASRGGIDFFPDGTSSGGRVALGMHDQTVRVDVEWLTGRIRVTRDDP